MCVFLFFERQEFDCQSLVDSLSCSFPIGKYGANGYSNVEEMCRDECVPECINRMRTDAPTNRPTTGMFYCEGSCLNGLLVLKLNFIY